MDFARRQLEKYGWSDGKGLGKNENGISEALKPKLKRSVTGVGHDAAAEFNEHWWSALYDKAAKNVEVEEKNGKTKKIKTAEDFTITNSTWRINKKNKNKSDNNESEYSEYFVKKATLTNGGTKLENESSESENEEGYKDVFKMTDEELFKACEGRTAHKGARHGLKATGKLARIAQQEQMLLTQTKYQGYSHAKKLKEINESVVEDTSVAELEKIPKSKKKKKRKRCLSNHMEAISICQQAESELVPKPNSEKLKTKLGDTSRVKDSLCEEKVKICDEPDTEMNADNIVNVGKSKKRKKRKLDNETVTREITSIEVVEESIADMPKKKKKKKCRSSTREKP